MLDDFGKSLFAVMCWWIWKKRCQWVFNGVWPDAREVIRLVNVQVEEFWRAKERKEDASRRVFQEDLTRHNKWVCHQRAQLK